MKRVSLWLMMYLAIPSILIAGPVTGPTGPIQPFTQIDGGFGLKFGENIVSLIVGYDPSMTKYIPEHPEIAMSKNMRFVRINTPPIDIAESIPHTFVEYNALVLGDGSVVEINVQIGLRESCQQGIMARAVFDSLSKKYAAMHPGENSPKSAAFVDKENNQIAMVCENMLMISYSSASMMKKLVSEALAAHQSETDKAAQSIGKGL